MNSAQNKQLSFKTIRNICFGLLLGVNLIGGLFFYSRLQDVTETMYSPIMTHRPYLNEIIALQLAASSLDLLLHEQIRGNLVDNQETIDNIEEIIEKTHSIRNKNVVSEDDAQHFGNFIKTLKVLKVSLIYYKNNRIYDSSSSSTEELYEIIDESIYKLNNEIDYILSLVTNNINKTDKHFLEVTK